MLASISQYKLVLAAAPGGGVGYGHGVTVATARLVMVINEVQCRAAQPNNNPSTC